MLSPFGMTFSERADAAGLARSTAAPLFPAAMMPLPSVVAAAVDFGVGCAIGVGVTEVCTVCGYGADGEGGEAIRFCIVGRGGVGMDVGRLLL
jgi:hypothetical protein